MHIKLVACCFALFTVVMAGVCGEWEERELAKLHFKSYRVNHEVPLSDQGRLMQQDDDPKEIIRNRYLMLLVAGGAFGGAVVCVMLRLALAKKIKLPNGAEQAELSRQKLQKLSCFFTVSLLTSLFCSGWVIKKYFGTDADAMFMGSFLLAAGNWVAWEVLAIIGEQLKEAAKKRGWLGVKDALTGTMIATQESPPLKENK